MPTYFRSILALSVLFAAACGSPERKYCNLAAECDPTIDVDQCVEDAEADYEEVEELGCDAAYDDLFKCLSKNGECDGSTVAADECEAEGVAFLVCVLDGATLTLESSI